MKRYLVALFIAFMLHFLLFTSLYFFLQQKPKKEKIKQQEHKVRVYLKNPIIKKDKKMGIKKPKLKKKKRVAPQKQQKSVKKEKVLKKQSKSKPIKKIKPKKVQTKQLKKQPQKIEKKSPLKKVEKTLPKPKQNDPLAWMYKDYAPQQTQPKKQSNNLSQNIQDLYGEKFAELTKGQQQYILDNQEIMRRITQGVLERVASVNLPRDLRVNRTNTIEFYLYPDGHISDFKFLEKSGVFILDETTKETIEYAYAKYPRPQEKTLIRYKVFYQLKF